jgi:hypothetical protein
MTAEHLHQASNTSILWRMNTVIVWPLVISAKRQIWIIDVAAIGTA